jgi:hypothetical protein
MVAYSSAWWACGWSCNNPGYAAFFKLSSTTFDHSSREAERKEYEQKLAEAVLSAFRTCEPLGESQIRKPKDPEK